MKNWTKIFKLCERQMQQYFEQSTVIWVMRKDYELKEISQGHLCFLAYYFPKMEASLTWIIANTIINEYCRQLQECKEW